MWFRRHPQLGATGAALVFGGVLLAWQIVIALSGLWERAGEPLPVACEHGRMTLGTDQMAQQTDAADADCQPFTSRLIAVNQAPVMALSAVPGIGPATAKKIVEDREKHGAFHSAADLERVPGIGATKAVRFAAYLSFE